MGARRRGPVGVTSRFDSVSFMAFLERDIKLRDGFMQVTLSIPPEQVDNALALRLVGADPVPLQVSIGVTEQFRADVLGLEAKLAKLSGQAAIDA